MCWRRAEGASRPVAFGGPACRGAAGVFELLGMGRALGAAADQLHAVAGRIVGSRDERVEPSTAYPPARLARAANVIIVALFHEHAPEVAAAGAEISCVGIAQRHLGGGLAGFFAGS